MTPFNMTVVDSLIVMIITLILMMIIKLVYVAVKTTL